jgi:hypothetical protein
MKFPKRSCASTSASREIGMTPNIPPRLAAPKPDVTAARERFVARAALGRKTSNSIRKGASPK